MNIRPETTADHASIKQLITKAFEQEPHSDHREQFLVERLRLTEGFIPELSLVAEDDGIIVGYILLTKMYIQGDHVKTDALALAPVAVLPEYQGRGIGAALIRYAHEQARELGHKVIVLLGHEDYYPRFGYKQANSHHIQLPFDAPPENCMVLELCPHALAGVSGTVVYPQAFYE